MATAKLDRKMEREANRRFAEARLLCRRVEKQTDALYKTATKLQKAETYWKARDKYFALSCALASMSLKAAKLARRHNDKLCGLRGDQKGTQ